MAVVDDNRDPHAWERMAIGWHAMIGLALAVACGLTFAHDDGRQRVAVLGLLLGCALWYAAFGARAIGAERGEPWYAVVAIPLVVVLFTVDPVAGGVMLFPLYPHIWLTLPPRRAVVATVILTAGIAAVQVLQAGPADRTALLLAMSGALAVALGVGFYIDRIVAQSTRRAELLDELARTRAELSAVSHEAGALAERERLSREIHDTVAQGFTSILLLVRAAGRADDPHPQLARIEETARDNLAESRALVAALAPPDLVGDGLPAALTRLLDRIGSAYGTGPALTATLDVDGQERLLPTGHDVVLLRVAQEALANVGKHAGAGHVTVTLAYGHDDVRLTVHDDGHGFDANGQPGFGLRGMRDRVLASGGVLAVESAPGAGTCVDVVL